jgi:hypothetical protein
MALTSPGVEVTIIDQSQYLPAPTSSVPLVILATAQNKADASGTGVAQATTAANANKLYQVTSQRDLVTLYGTPFFYTTTNGTPIQGYELNEYGLLAAYSLLGVTNRCYVLRADIDLASLVGQTGRPVGSPTNGTWWLDTTTSTWGIFEFNATTGKFVEQLPIVITSPTNLSGGYPLSSIGNIGDYAVNAIEIDTVPSSLSGKQFFYKTTANQWTFLGSNAWLGDIPTITGANAPTSLSAGDTFTLNINGGFSTTIAVPASTNNTVAGVAAAINALDYAPISAAVRDSKLCIFSKLSLGIANPYIRVVSGTGTVLSDLGIDVGYYYQTGLSWGTSAEMPLWTSSQQYPRPTGSIWMKMGTAGSGFNQVVSQYNATTASWVAKNVGNYVSDAAANNSLDPTGGQLIPANTVYAQYLFNGSFRSSPIYLWARSATGPTVVTGNDSTPTFSGPYTLYVNISTPGSDSLSSAYTVTFNSSYTAAGFCTAWSAANIPFTQASVTTDGAIQIVHTEGGEIVISDINTTTGISNGFLAAAGFVAGTTTGCKTGPSVALAFTPAQAGTQPDTSGTGLVPNVVTVNGVYVVNATSFVAAGSGYAVGDTVKFLGTQLGGSTPANDLVVTVTAVSTGAVTGVAYYDGTAPANYATQLSNWVDFTYTANEGAPNVAPANNTNWFYSVVDQVDIMVNYNGQWNGYGNLNYDSSGFPTATGSNSTDPAGPIISASTPTTQSTGASLEYGDLWISTANLEDYPVISRWESVNGTDQWVLLDNADQTSSSGVLFADARWAPSGSVNPADDPIPTIVSLLSSDYLDLDAPESSLYPNGMLLFNTRRSGYNVKQYRVNYFNSTTFPDQSLPSETDAWVSVSGLQSNGSPYMGRKAQRAMVVEALRSACDTNLAIRDEDNFFNLMASPNYPEMQPNMVVLNADRGETGYIIGDTPLGLADDATLIQAWATNAAGATSTGEEGLVTRNTYLGLFYPSGIAPDLSGNLVAVPASHMMLRTFLRNDTVSYPWLAAAGTRRGNIDNATNIGYLNRTTGEFQTIKTRVGIRDVLYINFINPLVFFTGIGLLNYGNKTSYNSSSALDRTNVARLIAYIRRQLTLACRPFVFEPNDALTRNQIAGVVETLLVDLVAKRGLYDYLVVCDESNNTPARIDRNELWIDVAVEPVKAAEFIYVPVRIMNTGELSAAG